MSQTPVRQALWLLPHFTLRCTRCDIVTCPRTLIKAMVAYGEVFLSPFGLHIELLRSSTSQLSVQGARPCSQSPGCKIRRTTRPAAAAQHAGDEDGSLPEPARGARNGPHQRLVASCQGSRHLSIRGCRCSPAPWPGEIPDRDGSRFCGCAATTLSPQNVQVCLGIQCSRLQAGETRPCSYLAQSADSTLASHQICHSSHLRIVLLTSVNPAISLCRVLRSQRAWMSS